MRAITLTLVPLVSLGAAAAVAMSGAGGDASPRAVDPVPPVRLANAPEGRPFVPNLGQWTHPARFVHRSGSMTVFVRDRGWLLDLHGGTAARKDRAVALRMTFAGAGSARLVGEAPLDGHHDYFLGGDPRRWRTEVPLYASVRYEGLYPGIDLRLRDADGAPEYDLLLQPGADLARVDVRVDGAQGMSIADDGSLVVETALGPLTQPRPKTWEVGSDGRKRAVACSFVLRGPDRFGFEVDDWSGDTSLTIDPGLLWSTYAGGTSHDDFRALSVDTRGVVTAVGNTNSSGFPTTTGAYDVTFSSGDAVICRFDPSKSGAAQLLYSTFLGGRFPDGATSVAVDASGVVTVAGSTLSAGFPTTTGAFDTTFNGNFDAFVARLDPARKGTAQLLYSTFVGGSHNDAISALAVQANGVITVAGETRSTNFPTTGGAYDQTYAGGPFAYVPDAFVSRLDPRRTGTGQLTWSTFLGGFQTDVVRGLAVDARGVCSVVGYTYSFGFPTTTGAFDRTHGGDSDGFLSSLDPGQTGPAQLVHSTFLGGKRGEGTNAVHVDSAGLLTVAGHTGSSGFPTTNGAYDTTFNGSSTLSFDAFVTRVDRSKTGAAQLVYSTFLGGTGQDVAMVMSVDGRGVVTIAGTTTSSGFPTTANAHDRTYNGASDLFAARLDPGVAAAKQLRYSTFLGGTSIDRVSGLHVDGSGVATLAGWTASTDYPTTASAFDRTFAGPGGYKGDATLSRLDMGVAMYADVHEISTKAGGTQNLTLVAGAANANRSYRIFGTFSGTTPGVVLLGIEIPLNVDVYTTFTIQNPTDPIYRGFIGTLDARGNASAAIVLPGNLPPLPPLFHHAYIVYSGFSTFHMASNAVPLLLR